MVLKEETVLGRQIWKRFCTSKASCRHGATISPPSGGQRGLARGESETFGTVGRRRRGRL